MNILLNREYDEYCSRCLTVVRAFNWYVRMTIDANNDNNDDNDDDGNIEYNEYSIQGV